MVVVYRIHHYSLASSVPCCEGGSIATFNAELGGDVAVDAKPSLVHPSLIRSHLIVATNHLTFCLAGDYC